MAGGRGPRCGDRPPPAGESVHGAAAARPRQRQGQLPLEQPAPQPQPDRRCRIRDPGRSPGRGSRSPGRCRGGRRGGAGGRDAGRGAARVRPGTGAAGPVTARRPGRASPAARSPPGMRARCCCTPSAAGPAPGRSWPPRRAEGARRCGAADGGQLCFALGAAAIEQFKHLTAAAAGPLAGLAALPDLRTIRPRLAAIADRTDPVALQRLFASARAAATRYPSGVYYVDDHFVPTPARNRSRYPPRPISCQHT